VEEVELEAPAPKKEAPPLDTMTNKSMLGPAADGDTEGVFADAEGEPETAPEEAGKEADTEVTADPEILTAPEEATVEVVGTPDDATAEAETVLIPEGKAEEAAGEAVGVCPADAETDGDGQANGVTTLA